MNLHYGLVPFITYKHCTLLRKFNFIKPVNRSMPKFTASERNLIQSIVATFSIKRIPDPEIIKEIYEQTKKSITRMGLYYVRQRIKKESLVQDYERRRV